MKFFSIGNPALPSVALLHGGGLSRWSYRRAAEMLSEDYHVITPVIDGHGEDAETTFLSIRDSAVKLLRYIDDECGGRVFALAGLSLGAQIALEALVLRPDIARCAVLESVLVIPMKMTGWIVPIYGVFYGLIGREWFARLQAGALRLPEALFPSYFEDSRKMSRQSLINLSISNGKYGLDPAAARIRAKVLVAAGEKEPAIMKKSARLLQEAIPDSVLYIAPGLKHGELSLRHTEEYVRLIRNFLQSSES